MWPPMLGKWRFVSDNLYLLTFCGPTMLYLAYSLEDEVSLYLSTLIYFVGCTLFYLGIAQQMALTTTRQTFFLCANVVLIYSGRRYILYLFGCFGILSYCIYHLVHLKTTRMTVTLSYCRVMFGIILLSIASGPGILTLINGALLLLLYNLSWIGVATNGQPMKRQFLFIIHFLTNAGLLLLSARYEEKNLSFGGIYLNGEHVINLIGFLGMFINNTIAILYQERYSVPYLTWRYFLLVFLSLVTYFTSRLFFAFSSVILLHEFTAIALILDNPDLKRHPSILVGQWIVIMTSYTVSVLLHLPLASELLSLGALLYLHKLIWKFVSKSIPTYTFLSLIVGLIIGSNILKVASVGIGVAWSIHSLRSKKEKKIIPVVLLLCVLLELVRWYHYGSHGKHVYNILAALDKKAPVLVDHISDRIIEYSTWIFWPYPIVMLFQEKYEIVILLMSALMVFGLMYEFISAFKQKEQPIDYSLPDELEVQSYNIIFPTDTEDSGILLELKTKKRQAFKIEKPKLEIHGTHFWDCLRQTLNVKEMKIVDASHPLVLTPKRMNIAAFNRAQEEWHGVIQLGTGKKGEKVIPVETIKSVLKRLVMSNNKELQIVVTYQSSTPIKKRGVLFRISTTPSRILNHKREKEMAQYEALW